MIKYNLLCKKCELTFDSWFASSKEYDKLKRKKLINCHSCGYLKVEKSLMAPKLISKNFSNKNEKKDLTKYQKIKKTIREYQKFIKNKKRDKGIYGTASKKDIKELKDEGIDAHLIPWVENKNN